MKRLFNRSLQPRKNFLLPLEIIIHESSGCNCSVSRSVRRISINGSPYHCGRAQTCMREQNASSVREPSVRGFRSQTRKHSSSPDNPFVELSLRFVDRSIRRKRSVEPSQILPLQVERDNRDSRFPFTIHEGIHN